jgi:AcrR family transcriptional regulator
VSAHDGRGPGATRREEILEAACRVIARCGVERLRMRDVAREAGVSSALVHYYCRTRDELLAQAFTYADERASAIEAEIPADLGAAERLERHLLVYLTEGSVIYENWILWREMLNHALFDPAFRPALESSYREWFDDLRGVIRAGQDAGSVAAGVDADAATRRLTAIVDGLGPQLLLGILDRDRCVALVREAIALELGGDAAAAGNGGGPAPATELAT